MISADQVRLARLMAIVLRIQSAATERAGVASSSGYLKAGRLGGSLTSLKMHCNRFTGGRGSEMVAHPKIVPLINQQIGNEFSAMLQYYAIAAHFGAEALPELAGHFRKQAEEEKEHALRFIQFLLDAGARVEIPGVPAPVATFAAAEDAVKLSLEQEERVTAQINALVSTAKAESDYTSDNFLQWFVKEQLEEVSSMDQLLRVVQRAGEANLLRVEEYLVREKSHGTAIVTEEKAEAG